MRTADLDVALSRENAECWLRPEIDQLAAEIAFVLWHVLVQGGWEAWIVPGGGLCVVVNEVHSGGVGETHFPSRWQWSKLGHWLLLDSISLVLTTIHADVLLATWVDPCGGPCIVVDEV